MNNNKDLHQLSPGMQVNARYAFGRVYIACCMPGESYCQRFRSLLLSSCNILILMSAIYLTPFFCLIPQKHSRPHSIWDYFVWYPMDLGLFCLMSYGFWTILSDVLWIWDYFVQCPMDFGLFCPMSYGFGTILSNVLWIWDYFVRCPMDLGLFCPMSYGFGTILSDVLWTVVHSFGLQQPHLIV